METNEQTHEKTMEDKHMMNNNTMNNNNTQNKIATYKTHENNKTQQL